MPYFLDFAHLMVERPHFLVQSAHHINHVLLLHNAQHQGGEFKKGTIHWDERDTANFGEAFEKRILAYFSEV